MKKNILIIYTGGTIGMQSSDSGYVPMPGFEALLQQNIGTRITAQLPNYDILEFEHLIDSSNLHPNHWTEIATTVEQHWQKYDGFIILHGTDTMAYTASALSFMLQGLNKPIILTGSQIPLSQLRNDAVDNLVTALILAGNYPIYEVCIYFNGRLLRGNRSYKLKSTGFDAFDSPNYPWLGQAGIHIELQSDLLLESGTPDFKLPYFDNEAVAVLPIYPGISEKVVTSLISNPHLKGLIIQSYGVGNPPDANKALMDAFETASKQGITILNLSQCLKGQVEQGSYASGSTLNQIGVIPGSDLTLEAAFAKLHFLISQQLNSNDIQIGLRTSICGEQAG